MAEPHCETCRFFLEVVRSNYNGDGECRFSPPQPDMENDRLLGRFPRVPALWWCGQYRPRKGAKSNGRTL